LETLDKHHLVHNDIKPQNYLVKYLNGPDDPSRIDIVLTDFGMVGQNSKGGTPIFASPECFLVKTNASDIFSLGRVFLFMMLPKESFLKFLFVPIISSIDRNILMSNIDFQRYLLGLIRLMFQTKQSTRIKLPQVRIFFDDLKRNSQIAMNSHAQTQIERIATRNSTQEMFDYIQDLDHIS